MSLFDFPHLMSDRERKDFEKLLEAARPRKMLFTSGIPVITGTGGGFREKGFDELYSGVHYRPRDYKNFFIPVYPLEKE